MQAGSSATTTAARAPVRKITITDAERWYWSSRAALVFVALWVSVPAPWAEVWGGSTQGSHLLVLALGVGWIAFSAALPRFRSARVDDFFQDPVAGLSICLDVVGLTGLLSVSGAAQNPFTLLYFVPITLAAIVAPRWTIRVALLSVAGFGVLLLSTTLALAEHRYHGHHAHFFQHVRGMAIALAVAGAFVTVFVHRIGRSLAEKEHQIAELSRQRLQDHLAIALGTLSAGAAHELGSPLGSVQLLAEELPHLPADEQNEAVRTIVSEVQRMKSIVHGMDSSQLSAEILQGGTPWSLSELMSDTEALSASLALEQSGDLEITQPRQIVSQIVRELIRNARAARPDANVSVTARRDGEDFVVTVEDDGPGFTEEQREHATEPFVSHTGGTGLGLFLASIHARQLGGQLSIESPPKGGARVALRLPLRVPAASGESPS